LAHRRVLEAVELGVHRPHELGDLVGGAGVGHPLVQRGGRDLVDPPGDLGHRAQRPTGDPPGRQGHEPGQRGDRDVEGPADGPHALLHLVERVDGHERDRAHHRLGRELGAQPRVGGQRVEVTAGADGPVGGLAGVGDAGVGHHPGTALHEPDPHGSRRGQLGELDRRPIGQRLEGGEVVGPGLVDERALDRPHQQPRPAGHGHREEHGHAHGDPQPDGAEAVGGTGLAAAPTRAGHGHVAAARR
jgi:hypothetical protein